MQRLSAAFGSFLFLVIEPGSVAGLIPWAISGWRFWPESSGLRGVGVALIVLGLIPLIESFARFAWKGVGTPAPILPTRHLVVSGFYRHVRNPMYVGVISVILGQALLFADPGVAVYAALIWLCTHLFVLGYEEPKLLQTFGDEYLAFRDHVPRWLPRLRAWRAGGPGL